MSSAKNTSKKMKHLFNHKLQTRISLFNSKFLTSLAIFECPLQHERMSGGTFDPIRLFNDYASSGLYNITNTRILHAHLLDRAVLRSDIFASNSLLHCYCKSGAMVDALKLFDLMPHRNVSSWNILISGYNENSLYMHSWGVFCRMSSSGFKPNLTTYEKVLVACSALQDAICTWLVYSLVMKTGFSLIAPVRTRLIGLFTKTCSFEDGLRAFRDVSCQNVVCWNTIISGAVIHGENLIALDIFREMRGKSLVPNNATYCVVLTACRELGEIEIWKGVQGLLLKSGAEDVTTGTALVYLYTNYGKMEEALRQFLWMPNRNVVSWTVVISGFVKRGDSISALKVFREMRKLGEEINEHTLTSVISACGKPEMFEEAIQIHSLILKTGFYFDASVGASLISMYSKVISVDRSEMVFRQMENLKNIGTWGAMAQASMLASFKEHGFADQAVRLFREMLLGEIVPDVLILNAILTACSVLRSQQIGKEIHGYSIRLGFGNKTEVCNRLLNMYSKCGDLESAKRVFDMMPQKDEVTCTSLVSGYSQNGHFEEALQLFCDMVIAELPIHPFTLSSILGVIALLNRPSFGTQIHARSTKLGLDSNVFVGSSLLMMYSKSGCFEDCTKAFDQIEQHDLIGMTSMIINYANHGKGAEALRLYETMKKEGIIPDSVTFVGVLSACSSSGLVEEAYNHLHSMTKDYGIEPDCRHYSCIADLLGQKGRLKEAEKFINNMPIKPNAAIWRTLLVACKLHGDIELGKLAAEMVRELEPSNAGTHAPGSNIYADAGIGMKNGI